VVALRSTGCIGSSGGAVFEVGVVVRLAVDGETLTVTWAERWVRDRIIARIPGGSHDPE
jgi:hypothetical protein